MSTTIGITNRPESALGLAVDRCLELHAGEEVSGIACRSYQSTLALLHMISGVPAERIMAAADASEALLEGREQWLDQASACSRARRCTCSPRPSGSGRPSRGR